MKRKAIIKAAQDGEADEERNVLFPAREQSAMVAQPGDGSFDDQASAVATRVVHPEWLCEACDWNGGEDHLDAQFCQASSKAAES